MTITGLELLKIVDVFYELDHEKIPGYFSVHCWVKEFGRRERERVYSFIYDRGIGRVYFFPYPENIRALIGNAANKKEAAEQAKEFLKLWLEDKDFHNQKANEISKLVKKKK